MDSIRKRIWKLVLAAALLLVIAGADVQPVRAAVKLDRTSMNLCVGDKTRLTLTGTSKKAKWKSSKPSVAKVSSQGTVKAQAAGRATVTATVGSKSYKCSVKVNRTFKVDETSISIKKNTVVTAYLSVNGSVKASVADKKICSVSFGKWDGDYMPLTITPKAVGSTTVTFTNSVNSESCTLAVKVTALPVTAAFETPTVSNGANYFIAGENTMNFSFHLNRDAKTTKFKIYNAGNEVVRVYNLGAVGAMKKMSVAWDGLGDDGNPVNGSFKYAVVANGTKTSGGSGRVLGVSPFGKGDGTQGNPFLVSNLAELQLIPSYNGACFVQDADIDFNYGTSRVLFDENEPFVGTYDGKYNSTLHQMINYYGYNSVFGAIGAEGSLKNVSMSNCVLSSAGSLLAGTNRGTIDGCFVIGNVICTTGGQAAMLVLANEGQIRGCTVSGNLSVQSANVIAPATLKAGGIAVSNSGMIAQCTSSVALTESIRIGTYLKSGMHNIYAGGIVADNAAGAFVTQCTFTGSIQADIVLPDNLKDMEGLTGGSTYIGYVAGSSQGYISMCTNAGADGRLKVQGTGTGMVQ